MENEVERGRRRRSTNYALEFKLKLAQQACEPGVSVAQLALQHELNTNMVFNGGASCALACSVHQGWSR